MYSPEHVAKIQPFVFAHKYFRRKVSEIPDFLMKVKNLYRDITKKRPYAPSQCI